MISRSQRTAWVSRHKASPRHGELFTIGFGVVTWLFGVLFAKLLWLLCLCFHLTRTGGGAMRGELIAAIIAGGVEGYIEIWHNEDKLRKRTRAVRHEDATMT